jgi:ectoine hydroxylase-related dioxygenase (phytanoyl-CoA dioxygenase family)
MLTAKQKFLLDTYGYIVVPNVVEPEMMDRVRQAMERMDEELETSPRVESWPTGKPRKVKGTPHFSRFSPCIEYDPSFLELAMHPKILAYAQDIVGGPVRFEEQECSINQRDPEETELDLKQLGWHRGISPDFSTYEVNGRNHYLWIKAIVFLTDIGPGDGGTSVIPGTHRKGCREEIVSELEPWMVHQAQGPAGSVLLFTEALIHSVTPILSDRKRYIMITGYVAPFMREYSEVDGASPEYLSKLGKEEYEFMTGEDLKSGHRYGFRMK